MPRAPKRPCVVCGRLSDENRCDEHKVDRQRQYDKSKRDKEAKRFYNSKTWKVVRLAKLAKDPFCQMYCADQNRQILASTVHHIDGNIWNIDYDNLQSACSACHSRHETLRRGGF